MRRREREHKAEPMPVNSPAVGLWSDIEPHVNDALSSLRPTDREAILLRYFEGKSLTETSAALGVSEAAAKMRIARALARLREHLGRRQIQVEAGALAGFLISQGSLGHGIPGSAIQPAPSQYVPLRKEYKATQPGPFRFQI